MENIKKLNEMRKQVKDELNYIPRWDFNQNMLRQAYWSLRMQSIGKKAGIESSKEEVLVKSIQLIKKDNPDFYPRINENFFDNAKLCRIAKDDSALLACFRKKEVNKHENP